MCYTYPFEGVEGVGAGVAIALETSASVDKAIGLLENLRSEVTELLLLPLLLLHITILDLMLLLYTTNLDIIFWK